MFNVHTWNLTYIFLVYQEKKLDEHFKYAEYNTSPFEIDLAELIKGDEEKLSRYNTMEEFMAFTEAF